MAYWTQNLENEPRELNRPEFHNVKFARKGDTWSNPSAGQKDLMIVEYVTKHVDPSYGAIWYTVTFSNPSDSCKGLNIAEGLGMGTFYQGEAK